MSATIARPAALRSKVTKQAQTTLPSGVRKALGVSGGDILTYVIEGDQAVIRKLIQAEDVPDPVLQAFLDFVAGDMRGRPEQLRGVPTVLQQRIRRLTRGRGRIDLSEPIVGKVTL